MDISQYISFFDKFLSDEYWGDKPAYPWIITEDLARIVEGVIVGLGDDFVVENQIAIHKDAVVHPTAILTGPVVVCKGATVGAHATLRGGVWLDENVVVGPSSEVKASIIFSGSAVAHMNYIGNSIVGANVNLEAGSIVANHHNEREHKEITVRVDDDLISTGIEKFGALIGDNSRIGANAVLSPGTVLAPGSVVKRLGLVEQVPQN